MELFDSASAYLHADLSLCDGSWSSASFWMVLMMMMIELFLCVILCMVRTLQPKTIEVNLRNSVYRNLIVYTQ